MKQILLIVTGLFLLAACDNPLVAKNDSTLPADYRPGSAIAPGVVLTAPAGAKLGPGATISAGSHVSASLFLTPTNFPAHGSHVNGKFSINQIKAAR